MNYEKLFNSLIDEALKDDQELIPAHELPSAKVFIQRIEKLKYTLEQIANGEFCDLRSVEEYANEALLRLQLQNDV